ncbi:MAG TPA: transglycosylase SLT domain-containing protein [Terriglobales bacterium]|nr:transglycosylase SLT domain-containing protein [Terriglobales bacterium]
MKRMNRAFVASSTLKPMAKQLLEDRTKPAYAGVQAYATKHAGTDEGAMANLVLAYAHILDREYLLALPYLKKAQPKSGELGDYVAYFTALAQRGQGSNDQVIAVLQDFRNKYPDSIFARDAAVMYVNALVLNNQPKEAIAAAAPFRRPASSDMELAVGRAYMKAGDIQNATDALRVVYFRMPLADEASEAGANLSSMGAMSTSYADRKTRADLLAQGRRYRDAVREYNDLLSVAPSQEERDSIQVSMAIAQYRGGDDRAARATLENLQVTGNANAQRLYFLSDIARDENDEGRFNDLLTQMRQSAPTSSWFEQALLSAGNLYLLKKDYDRAIDFYRELDQRFPTGRLGHYAHWKASWLTLRQGRTDDATKAFEEQISRYPGSAEIPAALYWRGRLAEDAHNVPLARAYYRKIVDRFTNYYYADRARDRLTQIGDGTVAQESLLDRIPPLNSPKTTMGDVPDDDLRAQKAHLLENCGMFDFAIKELQSARPKDGPDWTAPEVARLYQESGGYHRALNYMKRTVPTYFSLDYDALPRFYWETLFPRPYWADLKRYSSANALDPYLVASLIRQESEFNPGAVSRANALGLMQVMPGTGKKLAKEVKLKRFSPEQLLIPTTNIELGTRYFKELLNQFNGTPEYALAAYNAGSDRVQTWLNDGKFRDPQEFVESIPFTETREYVQAIMRNASVYKKLYPTP